MPILYGVTKVTITVEGRIGPNVLLFVDRGKIDAYGAIIDNVGVYPWKNNQPCEKEIKIVETGYPVSYISLHSNKYNHYQLDSGEPGCASAWCPLICKSSNHWISVSSVSLE